MHTHTFRCNHAVGDIPELIEAARESGYTTLGFSEHTILSDQKWAEIRLVQENVEEYFTLIDRQREIEAAKPEGMRIYSGMECESLDEYFSFYQEIVEQYHVDYLLGSNHFFPYEGTYMGVCDDRYDVQKKIKGYADYIIKGIESGLFLYIAHPDMLMAGKERWDPYIRSVMKEMMQAAKQHQVALEINLNGYRKGKVRKGLNLRYQYPFEEFWALAAEEQVDVVIGVDAHSPRNFAVTYPELEAMLKQYSLKLLDEEEIVRRIEAGKH